MSAKTPRLLAASRRTSGNSHAAPVSLHKRVLSSARTPTSMLTSTPECYVPTAMDTPLVPRTRSDPVVIEENSSVVVAVRVRPLSRREASDPDVRCVLDVSGSTITIARTGTGCGTDPHTQAYRFSYDHCLWSTDKLHLQYADQQRTYETVARPLLDQAFEGFNACLFAYGQTGSGKSYSIMGHDLEIGILPRFGRELFEKIRFRERQEQIKCCVEISYFEVYNEKIHDLLAPGNGGPVRDKKAAMRVREHPVMGPYVEDLSTFGVPSYDELMGWLTLGNKQRATAAAGMNDKSSRSHSVFTLTVTQTSTQTEAVTGEVHEHSRKSRINIVDLAGSERPMAVGLAAGADVRVKEGIGINQSLLTLGKVISGLAEVSAGKSRVFVPYRESVLTWLLKESLGGNSKTTMLATISPANIHLEDTLNTLRYAHQARSIVNMARVNEDPKARLIRELVAEIEKLRSGQPNPAGSARRSESDREEVRELQKQLAEMEEQRLQEVRDWEQRLLESNRSQAAAADRLRRTGIAFQFDNRMPNLVNLNEDPQLAETLLYMLNEGDTRVGRNSKDGGTQIIRLQGSLIQDNHCTLKHTNGVVTLVPSDDCHTYVNGHLISQDTKLNHGDRLVLGGNHYFRFNNPLEVQQGARTSLGSRDYAFARTELLQVQDAIMQEELNRERQRTRHEMLQELEAVKRDADFNLSLQKHGFEQQIRDLEDKNREAQETERLRLQREQLQLNVAELSEEMRAVSVTKTNYLSDMCRLLTPGDMSFSFSQCSMSPGRPGPFDRFLMINEANTLSQRLKLPYSFRWQDRLTENGLDIVLKVTDGARMLELPADQLRIKADLLRQMADGEKDLQLFNSTTAWMDDEHLPLSLSPKFLESLQCDPDISDMSFQVLQTPSSNADTPGIRRLLRRSLVAKPPTPSAAKDSTLRELEVCRQHSAAMLECFATMSAPTANIDVSKVLMTVVELHRDGREFSGGLSVGDANARRQFSLKLNLHLGRFLLHASKLSSLFSLRATAGDQLSDDYSRCVRMLGDVVIRIMQRHEVEAQSSISGAIAKDLEDAVYRCCQLIGQISTSMGISLTDDDDDDSAFDVEPDIGFHFLCGLELVTGNALNTAVLNLEECQKEMEILATDSFFGTMKDSSELVHSAFDVIAAVREWAFTYSDIHKLTSKARENDTDHLVFISIQARQLVINFSSLTDSTLNLHADVETFTKGESVNFDETFEWIEEIRGSVDALASHRRTDCKQLTKKFQECLKKITSTTHKMKSALRRVAKASSKSKSTQVKRHTAKTSTGVIELDAAVPSTNGHSDKPAVLTRKISTKKDRGDGSSSLGSGQITTTPKSTPALRGSPRGVLGYVDVSQSPLSVEHSPVGNSRLQSTSIWSSTLSPGSREVTPSKSFVPQS